MYRSNTEYVEFLLVSIFQFFIIAARGLCWGAAFALANVARSNGQRFF